MGCAFAGAGACGRVWVQVVKGWGTDADRNASGERGKYQKKISVDASRYRYLRRNGKTVTKHSVSGAPQDW